MTIADIALTVFIGLVVVLFILYLWLAKHFASMDFDERKLYEQELNQELDDTLAENALGEKELRDKVKNITKNKKP